MSKSQDKRIAAQTQPDWVCDDCGEKFGHGMPTGHIAVYHFDTCGVCLERKAVTAQRNFGYLRPEWKFHTRTEAA